MRVIFEIPDNATDIVINALYDVGDEIKLTSAVVSDPVDGVIYELHESAPEVMQ